MDDRLTSASLKGRITVAFPCGGPERLLHPVSATEDHAGPGAATLLLLGSGLAGAGLFGRKRLARKQS